jgi:hypothetical protein
MKALLFFYRDPGRFVKDKKQLSHKAAKSHGLIVKK